MRDGARARRGLAAAACAAAALLVFLPSLRLGSLNWDDDILVFGNPLLRAPWPALLRGAWTTAPAGAYQPLAFVVWGILGRAAGFSPFVFHAASILLHALAAGLAFLAARRLLELGLAEAGPSAIDAGAALAALVFAVHPLRVESVSWIAELRDPLSGVLWLAALLAYLRARAPSSAPPKSLVATSALFAAACLAKGTAVTFPLVLLCVDHWPLKRGLRESWREKIPLLAISSALGAVQIATQRGARASAAWRDHGLLARLAQTAYALVFYARKTILPSGLSPIYELRPPLDVLEPRFLASCAALAALVAWLRRARRDHPGVISAACAYALMILPLSGLFQSGSQLVADRYSYLAALPLAVLAGAALTRFSSGKRRRAAAAAAVSAVALLAAACVRQQSFWRDSETLWTRALSIDPDSGTALLGLGHALASQGRVAAAAESFARARRTDRACAADLARLLSLAREGQAESAEARRLRAALDPRPICRHAALDYAVARAALGDYAVAREGFLAALAADPDDAVARADLRRLERLTPPSPGKRP